MWWLLLLLLVTGVEAASIDSGKTVVTMEDGFVKVNEEYIISSQSVEDIIVPVPNDVTSVFAEMDKKDRACKVINSTARCGSTKSGNHEFTISYQSSSILGNLDDKVILKFNKGLPFKASEHSFILELPVGNIIPREPGKEHDFYLVPKPESVLSDGQRIIVTWKERDVQQVSIAAVTRSAKQFDWTSTIVIVLLTSAAAAGTTWYIIHTRHSAKQKQYILKKKKGNKTKKENKLETVKSAETVEATVGAKPLETIVPQFIENEQKVVDLLTATSEKEIWQKQLLIETQFTKAKLSRVIRNLETRGVVTKTIYGNTNKISLKAPEPKTESSDIGSHSSNAGSAPSADNNQNK